jgi:hypothetical protein
VIELQVTSENLTKPFQIWASFTFPVKILCENIWELYWEQTQVSADEWQVTYVVLSFSSRSIGVCGLSGRSKDCRLLPSFTLVLRPSCFTRAAISLSPPGNFPGNAPACVVPVCKRPGDHNSSTSVLRVAHRLPTIRLDYPRCMMMYGILCFIYSGLPCITLTYNIIKCATLLPSTHGLQISPGAFFRHSFQCRDE